MRKVGVLYRFDTRAPTEILSSGFHPRGDNRDLALHFMNMTYRDGSSGFVATTSDLGAALEFAKGHMGQSDAASQTGYIYRIRANPCFYDVAESMREHLFYLGAGGYADALPQYIERMHRDLHSYSWEHEYVTDRHIPGYSISDVMTISSRRLPDGELSIDCGQIRTNPYFIPADTYTNTTPYPIPRLTEDFSPCSSPSLSELSSDEPHVAGPARATGAAPAQIAEPCIPHAPRIRR